MATATVATNQSGVNPEPQVNIARMRRLLKSRNMRLVTDRRKKGMLPGDRHKYQVQSFAVVAGEDFVLSIGDVCAFFRSLDGSRDTAHPL